MRRLRFRYADLHSPPGGFRGALHCHTTRSDGRMELEELVALYRSRGFSFLCVTDHSLAGPARPSRFSTDDFLVLPGIEVSARTPGHRPMHVLAVNVVGVRLGAVVGLRRLMRNLLPPTALVFAAHPHWTDNRISDILGHGFLGVEIFNYGAHRETGKGYGLAHWDAALAAGEDLLGVAVDDTHGRRDLPDWGGGWVGVFCPRLDRRGLLGALRRGRFYSSNGPEIHDLRIRRGILTAVTSPVTIARIVGRNGYHRAALVAPSRRKTVTVTLPLPDPEEGMRRWGYVRFECQDERTGATAWTNALFGPCTRPSRKARRG